MIKKLVELGVKSDYAYIGAFASMGLSWLSYAVSRGKKGDDKGQSDRWGIYTATFAPTLFALGVALKLEETD